MIPVSWLVVHCDRSLAWCSCCVVGAEVTFGPGLLITLTAVLSFVGLLVEPAIFPGAPVHHHPKGDVEASGSMGQSTEEDCKEDHDAAKDNLF